MKIGEVAERVGVSASTLRMYEQRGLIDAGRSEGGTRRYDDEDVARFQAIVALVRAEVPIDTLARLAAVRNASATGAAASRQVAGLLADAELDLSQRLAQVQAGLADLRRAQARLSGCHGCRKRPTRENCATCAVAVELLECSVMRVVWDRGERNAAATAGQRWG